MYFKNMRIYRGNDVMKQITAEALEEACKKHLARPCEGQTLATIGFISPFTGDTEGLLVHAADGHLMIEVQLEEKILPGSVIADAVAEKVKAIEKEQNRSIFRKEKSAIKDEVIAALAPAAFSKRSRVQAVISPKAGLFVVNTASASKAEEIMSLIREVLGTFPVAPIRTKGLAADVMSAWVRARSPAEGFVIANDCEMVDPLVPGGKVSCKNQEVESDEYVNHLELGKVVSQLALNWGDKLRFVLTKDLALKKVVFGDVILEKTADIEGDAKAVADAELVLMMGTILEFVPALIAAMGGEYKEKDADKPEADASKEAA